MTKKENVLEKCRINLDSEKTQHSITRIQRDKYKQRIDKAIEYCYELQERYCHSALFDDLVASKIYEISEKQLNILKGDDKE